MQSKLWDTVGVITGTRIASNGRIVSYDLDINGMHSTRHRKFLQKCNLPNVRDDKSVEDIFLVLVVKQEVLSIVLTGEFCSAGSANQAIP